MTIEKITRASCRKVRDELNAELIALGEKLGLTIHAGSASYDDSTVTFKVACTLKGVDKKEEDFKRDCHLFDLPEDAYGKKFSFQGRWWILRGLKTRAPKLPIIASKVGLDGNFKLPERAIESLQAS